MSLRKLSNKVGIKLDGITIQDEVMFSSNNTAGKLENIVTHIKSGDPLIIVQDEHDESVQKEYMGRMISIDSRDSNYLMRFSLSRGGSGLTYRYYKTAAALDQGEESSCVGHSGEQFLLSAPVKNIPFKNGYDLYRECQQHDEWDGEEPLYYGTSVRALFKVLKTRGYVEEYTWAFDAETVARYILESSPVILGTDWYASMMQPDAIHGFLTVRKSSGLVGGHGYMLKGFNRNKLCPDGSRGAFRIINSWGLNWGQSGMAWLSFKDADFLIKSYGEACTAKEIKFVTEGKG